MKNGIIRADTSEKIIKNGTTREEGGNKKIGDEKGGQAGRMSDGSRAEEVEEEGDIARTEEDRDGRMTKGESKG